MLKNSQAESPLTSFSGSLPQSPLGRPPPLLTQVLRLGVVKVQILSDLMESVKVLNEEKCWNAVKNIALDFAEKYGFLPTMKHLNINTLSVYKSLPLDRVFETPEHKYAKCL